MTSRKHMVASLLALSLFAVKPAKPYDIDCAIMLCMAGGFPSNPVCAGAYAEMVRRVTPWPIRPPFCVCSFSDIPIELGGTGRRKALDISGPDYDWLRKTRVLWWYGRHWKSGPHDKGHWSWSLRSCDFRNRNCQYLSRGSGVTSPWPESFTTENGMLITPPGNGIWSIVSRAVMVEYGDHEGNISQSDWQRY